jgi:hypothetical protein
MSTSTAPSSAPSSAPAASAAAAMPIVYANNPGDFDATDLTFVDNTVCHQDNYLVVVSGKCLVLHSTPTELWVLANPNLQRLICSIDVQFLQYRSEDYPSYLRLAETMCPSLKMSPGGEFNLLKITMRSNTEVFGTYAANTYIRAVLYAHYNRNQISWIAQKVQYANPKDNDNESHLELIKI